jgi:alpha-mannosidase
MADNKKAAEDTESQCWDSEEVHRDYQLNYGLIARQGPLPSDHSFVSVQRDSVVLTALKKAEEDNSLIVRSYEWASEEADVKLQRPAVASSASETDLIERRIGDLPLQNNAVTGYTKPYEIRTVRVRFAATTSMQVQQAKRE